MSPNSLQQSNSFPKLIAFYLPQFHPTPENDRWWGKGFTEWTNVTKAKPLFKDHYQPHLPGDLGFYDLRLREVRHEQIKLAKKYGIDGFCYHYYWFSGTRLLNRPMDDMLADQESDMPFCLCWANENWTRRWDAADHEILISQHYHPEDNLNFIKSLIPIFMDHRYIRVEGKPLLIVYRPQHLPDAHDTAKAWREFCRSVGLGEIHLCAALTRGNENYEQFGFDSGLEFPPHNIGMSQNISHSIDLFGTFQGYIFQYADIANSYLKRSYGSSHIFKTVFPSWDNTARTGDRALIVTNGTPDNYEFWLSSVINLVQRNHDAEQLVFINAWNEWAEGCHLEPDHRFGHGFLQATLNAKNQLCRFTDFPDIDLPSSTLPSQKSFLKDLFHVINVHLMLKMGTIKHFINKRPLLRKMVIPPVVFWRTMRTKCSILFSLETTIKKPGE